MRLAIVFQILRHLLLVILCLSSLWMVTSCSEINVQNVSSGLCISDKKHTKHRRQNDNFSMKTLADSAQTRAFLSPAVFLGTLRSVLVQRDGTIRAWFAVDSPLKMNASRSDSLKRKEDTEVVYYRSGSGHCLLEVNQDNLKLGSQYLVFGSPSVQAPWPSLSATALPIPNDKRTLRAIKRIICEGCAKPASISGLQKVRVEEGDKIQLHCHLAGNPIPWVEWYRNGVKVERRGRLRVKTKRRTSRLVIRRARTTDRGMYECRAGNIVSQDTVSSSSTVVVTRKKTTKSPKKRPSTTTTAHSTTTAVSTTTQSSPWTTEPCPISDFCLNGGTCIFYKAVREYVCHCAEGFIGLRCDYKDVSISVGEVKNLDQNHGLFIDILVLFLIFFCLNWACLGICWLCCFRCQHKNWGKIREMALLQKFLKTGKLSDDDKVSVDVPSELCDSNNGWIEDKWNKSIGPKKIADDNLETRDIEF